MNLQDRSRKLKLVEARDVIKEILDAALSLSADATAQGKSNDDNQWRRWAFALAFMLGIADELLEFPEPRTFADL